MNKSALKAIAKLYERIPYSETILEDIDGSFLTEDTARNGREVLWYMNDLFNEAVYIDTLEFLTEEEIAKELC